MFGGDIGSLTAYVINSLTKKEVSVFQKVGSQVNTWRQALVRIDPLSVDYDFSLAFEAKVGYDYTGALAIDEIEMRFSCPVQSFCDFEVDTCSWVNDTSADFTWTRANNATDSAGTGPSTDHTTLSQLGYYMYIETSSPRRPGQKARLISANYGASTACFKFWYHLFGRSIGGLNVWLRQGNALTKQVWRRSGDLGDQWRYGHVTVRSPVDYQVVIEGVVGNGFSG